MDMAHYTSFIRIPLIADLGFPKLPPWKGEPYSSNVWQRLRRSEVRRSVLIAIGFGTDSEAAKKKKNTEITAQIAEGSCWITSCTETNLAEQNKAHYDVVVSCLPTTYCVESTTTGRGSASVELGHLFSL